MKKYYSLVNCTADRKAELYIFGDIVDAWNTGIDEVWDMDLGEVSGLSIAKDLQGLDVDQIDVYINSRGGYTSEGLTIHNMLQRHKAKIVTHCDGFACSAASLVFMAGDERLMNNASALMIHNAWTDAEGNAAQLRQQADVLDQISTLAANVYEAKASISREELDAMLDGENHEGTWINPQDAVTMGFATGIEDTDADSNSSAAVKQFMQSLVMPKAETADTDEIVDKLFAKFQQALSETEKNIIAKAPASDPKPPVDPEPQQKTVSTFLDALTQRRKD